MKNNFKLCISLLLMVALVVGGCSNQRQEKQDEKISNKNSDNVKTTETALNSNERCILMKIRADRFLPKNMRNV